MKPFLYTITACILLFSCNKQNADSANEKDTFSIYDGSLKYFDAVSEVNGRMVITRDIKALFLKDSATDTYDEAMIQAPTKHIDTCNDCNYSCEIHKTGAGGLFSMRFKIHSEYSFAIHHAKGPATGVGIFKAIASDSTYIHEDGYNYMSPEVEPFNKVVPQRRQVPGPGLNTDQPVIDYKLDSVTVEISKSSGTHVHGSYKFWMSSTEGKKVLKGDFNCNHAVVD